MRFYSFELDDGARSGLVRSIEENGGYTLERVGRSGEWVDDPNLIRHFADPGDSELVAISEDETRELAKRYAVDL